MPQEGPALWARDVKALFESSGMSQEIQEKKDALAASESIFFASDYGGEDQGATYRTYVFLVISFDSIEPWFARIRGIYEKRFGGVPRTMDFKKLNDKVKQRALSEWLEAGNRLNGCLFTLSVHADLKTIFGQPHEAPEVANKMAAAGLGRWPDATAEKVLRILHFQGFLSSLLLRDGQKVFWMTDHDSICPNLKKMEDLNRAWPRVLYLYLPKGFRIPKHHIQTPFEPKKPEDRIYNETLTYPDLAAGALQELFAHHIRTDGTWKKTEGKAKTVEISRWLAIRGTNLKRFNIRLDGVQENESVKLVANAVRLDPVSQSIFARAMRTMSFWFWSFIERITRTEPQKD